MPFSRSAFSGFPFDREDRDDRDDDFRSQLDDIANRHPEFADHLGGFPFRADTLGRRRPPRPTEHQEFRRFAERPFGSSRFEHFGFPFSDFEDDFKQQQAPPQQSTEQQQSQPKEQQEEEKPRSERGRKQNIQQSNTVDLGQKQEPVNDRNQRSMSAPPDNRQRYVSSIHIPINRDGGMGDMGKAQSQPQPQQPQQEKPVNKPTERVIPIHVEGRDEPVMPKHTGPSFSQAQPERIFGRSPSQFTQFVGQESPRQYAAGPEWHHTFGPDTRQQKPPQAQKFQQQSPPPQQPQREAPMQKQEQVPQQQEPQPQPQPQPCKNSPIDNIQAIQRDVSALMGQVERFSGLPRDKQYLYLDEMLTRNLLKLDNIDTQGQENIRQARREAVKCIERCISILEAKAAANVPHAKKPEDTKSEETQSIPEPKPEESQPAVEEKMEVEKEQVESKEKTSEEQEKVEVEIKESEPKLEEKIEAKEKVAPASSVEETMEVAPESAAPTEEVKPQEQSETKADEEMKETVESKDDASQEEKKKGTKKIVQK